MTDYSRLNYYQVNNVNVKYTAETSRNHRVRHSYTVR